MYSMGEIKRFLETFGKMSYDVHNLMLETNALTACLIKSGAMRSTDFDIEKHRCRFEWYSTQHPDTSLGGNVVRDTLLKHIGGVLAFSDAYTIVQIEATCTAGRSHCAHSSRVYAIGGLNMQGKRSIGGGLMQALDTVESLDVRSGDWDPLMPVPAARLRAGSAVANGRLYLLGGLVDNHALADADRLDMLKGVWESGLEPMLTPRAACAGVGAGNAVYVLGGSSDGTALLNTGECYNERKNSWSQVPAMTSARVAFAVTKLGNSLYVLGGLDAKRKLNAFERLDLLTNTWHQLPPLRSPRSDLAAASTRGRVIAIGGSSDDSKGANMMMANVECFVIDTGMWESMPNLPQPVMACAAVVSKGRIYVLGGSDGKRALPAVQLLMPGEKFWRVGPPMKNPRMAVAAGTILMSNWEMCPASPRKSSVHGVRESF